MHLCTWFATVIGFIKTRFVQIVITSANQSVLTIGVPVTVPLIHTTLTFRRAAAILS